MENDKFNRINEAKRKIKIKITVVVVVAAVLLIGGTVWLVKYLRKQEGSRPGMFYVDQGRDHVGLDHKFDYNSNPPSSGPHFAQPADWGVYKEELDDRILIHNLEHGGVWISYRPDIPEDIKKKLEGFYEKYGRKIIVTPRAKNDTDISLAVWNYLDKFNVSEYADERVDNFIRRLKNKTAPEPFAP